MVQTTNSTNYKMVRNKIPFYHQFTLIIFDSTVSYELAQSLSLTTNIEHNVLFLP